MSASQTAFSYYSIWRRQMPDNRAPTVWFLTAHSIKARNDEEAAKKLAAMFRGAGFHSMSLVAVPSGQNPNFDAKGYIGSVSRDESTCPVCDGGHGNNCACSCHPDSKKPL